MTMNIRSVIEIRYAQIRSLDLSNGEGIGVALFVQGCHFKCKGCFNPETWDFSSGKEWTEEIKEKFLGLVDRPYIKRVSLLGGECLAEENLDNVLDLVTEINKRYNTTQDRVYVTDKNNNILTGFPHEICLLSPQKSIWLYTGYTWEDIMNYITPFNNVITTSNDEILYDYQMWKRQEIIKRCNVLIDGQYIDSQRDIALSYRGSSNQRLIDIQQSLQKGEIVLWQT